LALTIQPTWPSGAGCWAMALQVNANESYRRQKNTLVSNGSSEPHRWMRDDGSPPTNPEPTSRPHIELVGRRVSSQ
jgi:hypothetical protein